MINLIKISTLISLSLLFLNPIQETFAQNIYMVSGSKVNIRGGAGTSHHVIHTVRKGEFVMVTDFKNEWAKVYYLKDSNKGGYGWIHIKYLVKAPSDDYDDSEYDNDHDFFTEERMDPSEADISLSITNADFKCKENLYGVGFRECILEIDYSLSSDYQDDLDVSVECEADFQLEYKDNYIIKRKSESERESEYINSGYGSGSMEITVKPLVYETLIRAKVKDLSCKASNDS